MKTRKAKEDETELLGSARAELLRAAIESFDGAELDHGSGREFRARFIKSLHEVIEHESREMTVLAMKNDIPQEEKATRSFKMAVAQLYLAALVELIECGNAQWDDSTLLPMQFKEMLRNVMRRSQALDLETGDVIV